jgi:tRNA nucleotidyltransferase (CCA-adding enzyme)
MTITKVYEVGGAVRERFRGGHSNDLDYAIEAPSYEAMRDFVKSRGAEIFIEHPDFVTIRAHWRGQACDFTLCRKEGEYHDNRHPSSCEPGTILEDLARRDFTMNAIAVDTYSGGVIDPYNGITDIKNLLIRTVGDADHRFQEDALRIMRALRFSVTLGFQIHPTVRDSMYANMPLLDNISAERIKDELGKMFKHDTVRAIEVLQPYWYHIKHIFNERTHIWLQPTMKAK